MRPRNRLGAAFLLAGLSLLVGCGSVTGTATSGTGTITTVTSGGPTSGPDTSGSEPTGTSTSGSEPTGTSTSGSEPTSTNTSGSEPTGTGSEPPTCPASAATPHLDADATPILTVSPGTNSWIASPRTEPLALAVYANGTGLQTSATGQTSEPLPEFRLGAVTDCQLKWAESELQALAGLDLGNPGVTDQGTTVIVYRPQQGSAVTFSVYAFGIGDENLTADQRTNRSRLHTVLDTLKESVKSGSVWQPTRLRVLESVGRVEAAPLPWPAGVPLEKVLIRGQSGSRCGVIDGAAAASVLKTLGSGPSRSSWQAGATTKVLVLGALVPGQPDCV